MKRFYLIPKPLSILQWHNAQHHQGGIVQQAGQQIAQLVAVVLAAIVRTQARHILLRTPHRGRIVVIPEVIPEGRLDHAGLGVVQGTGVVR